LTCAIGGRNAVQDAEIPTHEPEGEQQEDTPLKPISKYTTFYIIFRWSCIIWTFVRTPKKRFRTV